MKVASIIFAGFLMILVILANFGLGSIFYDLVNFFPGRDKTGHFFLFGIMSYLLNMTLNGEKVTVYKVGLLKGSLILASIVTIEEVSQYFLPSRTFSWMDLLAGYAGIYLFGFVSKTHLKYKARIIST